MIILKKGSTDFRILNLTDPQLSDDEWTSPKETARRNILMQTVAELVGRVKPDLITISGDLACAGQFEAYRRLADFLDSFRIPWAPVWGNHDNQDGPEAVEQVVVEYMTHPYCLYERGAPALGNGNYVIAIEEDGKIVTGLIMLDSHDRAAYIDDDSAEKDDWARLIPAQLDWYREQVAMLQAKGCHDTAMILHIPIYAYRTAFRAAIRDDLTVDSAIAKLGDGWNEQHSDAVGVCLEWISSYPLDDGVFEAVKELGSTRHIICGHDHVNNTIIRYEGVKLVYSLKTGPGCYWTPILNGGTVLTVASDGIADVRHEFVNLQ